MEGTRTCDPSTTEETHQGVSDEQLMYPAPTLSPPSDILTAKVKLYFLQGDQVWTRTTCSKAALQGGLQRIWHLWGDQPLPHAKAELPPFRDAPPNR